MTRIFAKGDWSVYLTYNTVEDITWCAAYSENRAGQWFSIVAYDEGGAAAQTIASAHAHKPTRPIIPLTPNTTKI